MATRQLGGIAAEVVDGDGGGDAKRRYKRACIVLVPSSSLLLLLLLFFSTATALRSAACKSTAILPHSMKPSCKQKGPRARPDRHLYAGSLQKWIRSRCNPHYAGALHNARFTCMRTWQRRVPRPLGWASLFSPPPTTVADGVGDGQVWQVARQIIVAHICSSRTTSTCCPSRSLTKKLCRRGFMSAFAVAWGGRGARLGPKRKKKHRCPPRPSERCSHLLLNTTCALNMTCPFGLDGPFIACPMRTAAFLNSLAPSCFVSVCLLYVNHVGFGGYTESPSCLACSESIRP